MKHKLTGIVAAAFLLISMIFSGAAYAQDDGLPSPGTTPDSPFYFFDKLGKNISMAFTFGTEAKAQKALKYAEERLAEAQKMASENKTAELERAIIDYEKYITWLKDKLGETRQNSISGNISERVALATANHLEVLERVKVQVSEQAKKAITHAENVSVNGQINALRALGKAEPVRALDICDNVTLRQTEKIRTRATGNITSGNLTALLDYAERIADLEDEMTETAEASGINVTAIQQRMANSTTNRLEVLTGVYEKVPEKAQPAVASAIENSVLKYEKVIDKLTDKNITSAVSVNDTIKKIPEKLQEKVLISTSNKAPTGVIISGNVTTNVKPLPTKAISTANHLENKETPKPVTASANQTKEPAKTVKPGNNP